MLVRCGDLGSFPRSLFAAGTALSDPEVIDHSQGGSHLFAIFNPSTFRENHTATGMRTRQDSAACRCNARQTAFEIVFGCMLQGG
jgi:hypothetical protein